MNSCKVIVLNDALDKNDVSFAATPKSQLRAIPFGMMQKQIVRSSENLEQDIFSVFDAATNIPADITGMALFLTIYKSQEVVFESKGRVNSDIKGIVSFKPVQIEHGFYKYEVSVKAANEYSDILLYGSYVVRT